MLWTSGRSCSQDLMLALSEHFVWKWMYSHTCDLCNNRILVLDGNQKAFCRLCQYKDCGHRYCKPLGMSLRVGCTKRPCKGSTYCKLHRGMPSKHVALCVSVVLFRAEWCDPISFVLTSMSYAVLARHYRLCKKQIDEHGMGVVVQRRISDGQVEYKVQWSTRVAKWICVADVPAFMIAAGDTLHESASRPGSVYLTGGCSTTTGPTDTHSNALQIEPSELSEMCNTQKDGDNHSRRSAGWLAAVRPCHVTCYLTPMILSESLPAVYAALAEIVESLMHNIGINLASMSQEGRDLFLLQWLPLVIYDNGCSLLRYMRHERRCSINDMTRLLAKVKVCVDTFHFKNSHKGCKPDGSKPLRAVWPDTHKDMLSKVDSQACEHVFSYVRRHVTAMRNFDLFHQHLYIHIIMYFRNLVLERGRLSRTVGHNAQCMLLNLQTPRLHKINELYMDGSLPLLNCLRKNPQFDYEVLTSYSRTRYVLCRTCFCIPLSKH